MYANYVIANDIQVFSINDIGANVYKAGYFMTFLVDIVFAIGIFRRIKVMYLLD